MRNATGLLFLMCLTCSLALGATDGKKYQHPQLTHADTSAPDPWGYTWVKNTDPGGPTFNWVDITTRGTPVTGLTDDNVSAQYNMLFNFPYYWYTANRFRVGSNGYIQFDNTTTAFAPAFAPVPSTSLPNDMMAICVGDLVLSGQAGAGGQCLYWTNAVDSLVVSFINVTEWESVIVPANTHTFQVILNRADSSITYQYGRQAGRYNTTNNNRLVIGIENATGQIGLQYAYSTAPPHALMPDSGLAIKIKRTVNTGLAITDAGIVGGLNATNLGEMAVAGVPKTIRAVVKNFGTATVNNAPVRYAITRAGQPSAFDTVIVPTLAPSQEVTVTFPRLFTPAVTGSYSALFNVTVPSDVGPGNNSKTTEITSSSFSLSSNTVIQYENGTAGGSINWIGGGGMGVAFDLPPSVYPVRIESVYVSIAAITTQPLLVQIMDGSTGSPGAVLAERTAVTAVVGMNGISFRADSIRIPGGRFFVGTRGQMAFNYELTAPISNRSWEYTGGWAPYRSGDLQDVIIRASVRQEPAPVGYFHTFEALTVGGRLACQDTANWTTWSNLPCNTTEDPLVSNAFAFSGTKSVVIAQNNDLIKKLGNDTSGIHVISFKFYIPSGKAGYFNTLATRVLPSTFNWAMEAYFDSAAGGNNGRLFAGAAAATPFSYAHNAWQTATVIVNLNIDSAKFFINGTHVRTWRWTAGASGGGSPRRLAANNFYGATAWDQMYVDDYDYHPTSVWTGVDDDVTGLPEVFALMQNYPNPFNPTTNIRYALPKSAHVMVRIYNLLGQEIAQLKDEIQTPGAYDIVWHGKNSVGQSVASGVYFYRLEAQPVDGSAPFSNFKKMLFLK